LTCTNAATFPGGSNGSSWFRRVQKPRIRLPVLDY